MPDFAKIIDEMEWRGLIYQSTPLDQLKERLNQGPITLYAGFDPTADSLHIGHLVPILSLKRFQEFGHKPIAVVGGATALLGDPSGKEKERDLSPDQMVGQWAELFKGQLKKFIDFDHKTNPAILVNNYDWISKISAFSFLREIGKKFSVNVMMSKDSVKSRLTDPDKGISYTEFSYMIMQAYDYLTLNQDHNCELQVGGSDQWGNITAGQDLIWKTNGKKVHSMTFPLIQRSDGKKIGKTEAGVVWLDPEKTSPYELYQYWLNTDDRDVIRFMKYYTFLSKQEIDEIEAVHNENPGRREAHRKLAYELTTLIHDQTETKNAIFASRALFGDEDVTRLNAHTLEGICKSTPHHVIEAGAEMPAIVDLMVDAGFFDSRGASKKEVMAGGVYLNNQRITDISFKPGSENLIAGKFLILRKGKKNFKPVKVG
ncbi:MAG: tyrosine--tRNA ligase [Ignavibacteriaceae bacterium]|nr:tyrosine--tRNA ligase [Ignavibacteriaceae bacterium]